MASVQAPVARVPFAPLDNPRLQHLASAKNRQNGLAAQKSTAMNGKPGLTKSFISPGKRPFDPSTFDDFDGENVDPALLDSPSKKSKGEAFTFSLAPQKSMAPPPAPLSTPSKANICSPRAPLTAPAGRSPKRKIAGIGKSRRVSAPFTRIDPPFTSSSLLPFSLDAALNGTFSTKTIGVSSQKSMPKNWFFDIYEDTPEEEAANLMEHSTLTLDLSSDEESDKKERSERGKENMPPEGYDALAASRSLTTAPKQVKKTDIVRQKTNVDEMEDGQRSPLSDLETEPFIPEGLEKNSHVVVDEREGEKEVQKEVDTSSTEQMAASVPVIDAEGDVKGEIIVWEDKA